MNQEVDGWIADLEEPGGRLRAIEELATVVALTVTVGARPEVREEAREVRGRCLSALGGGRFLDDPEPTVRAMILALWDLMRAQEEVDGQVLDLLEDPDRIVRCTASFTAARLKEVDEGSLAILRSRLASEDLGERFASAFCLACLQDRADRTAVEKALREGEAEPSKVASALEGCPYLADGVPALVEHGLGKLAATGEK